MCCFTLLVRAGVLLGTEDKRLLALGTVDAVSDFVETAQLLIAFGIVVGEVGLHGTLGL